MSTHYGTIDKDTEDYRDGQFNSHFKFAASSIGCAVGTGNFWRFVRVLAVHSVDGGLAFILVWALLWWVWSIPLLIVEFALGFWTKRDVLQSTAMISHDMKPKKWLGAFIVLVTAFIGAYYSVVIAWCMYYFFLFMGTALPTDYDESNQYWDGMLASYWPLVIHLLTSSTCGFIVYRGVQGVAWVNVILVPLIITIVLACFVWSLTLSGSWAGITQVFSVTGFWRALGDPLLWTDALSQGAFDTSAGSGRFTAYAGYMRAEYGTVKSAVLTPIVSNMISLISGVTTFATVYATLGNGPLDPMDVLQDSGPGGTGVTFIWMPLLFGSSNNGVFATLYFFSLAAAGVTSLMSYIEMCSKSLIDLGIKRSWATFYVTAFVMALGMVSALDIDFLVNQDYVWGNALILCGLIMASFVISFGVKTFRTRHINAYSTDPNAPPAHNDADFKEHLADPVGHSEVLLEPLPGLSETDSPSSDFTDGWFIGPIWEYIMKYGIPIQGAVLLIWLVLSDLSNDALVLQLIQPNSFSMMVQCILVAVVTMVLHYQWDLFTKAEDRVIGGEEPSPLDEAQMTSAASSDHHRFSVN